VAWLEAISGTRVESPNNRKIANLSVTHLSCGTIVEPSVYLLWNHWVVYRGYLESIKETRPNSILFASLSLRLDTYSRRETP
jgi:hypothetical protein